MKLSKAGDNVVWNGTEWDNLSGVVDLSAYCTKAELDKKANIESPTFTGTATASNLTVTNSLNIPGGKIWIE